MTEHLRAPVLETIESEILTGAKLHISPHHKLHY